MLSDLFNRGDGIATTGLGIGSPFRASENEWFDSVDEDRSDRLKGDGDGVRIRSVGLTILPLRQRCQHLRLTKSRLLMSPFAAPAVAWYVISVCLSIF